MVALMFTPSVLK